MKPSSPTTGTRAQRSLVRQFVRFVVLNVKIFRLTRHTH